MRQEIQDFLDYLDETTDSEYGDFKRRTDMRLMHLIESQRHLTLEEVQALTRVRHELLWSHEEDPDMDKVKMDLREVVSHLH
ncbi:hypothetical protein D3C87_252780 [compost metagenome]